MSPSEEDVVRNQATIANMVFYILMCEGLFTVS